jgi:hypothetical protein
MREEIAALAESAWWEIEAAAGESCDFNWDIVESVNNIFEYPPYKTGFLIHCGVPARLSGSHK